MRFADELGRVLALSALFVLYLQRPAQAQSAGSISGFVFDQEANVPMNMAAVVLWQAADTTMVTGVVTDDKGRFLMDNVGYGAYLLQISFLGFEQYTSDRIELNATRQSAEFPDIRLASRPNTLSDIEVVGERDLISVEIDRTAYSIKNDPSLQSGDGAAAMESLPSVEIDADGSVLLRGSASVAVLVDGRPAPVPADMLVSYLEQLPASMIDRIEIMTTPSAEFDPDGSAGIINIILVKEARFARSGSIQLDSATNGNHGIKSGLNFYSGKWSVLANYTFQLKDSNFEHDTFRENLQSDPMSTQAQDANSFTDSRGHLGALTLNYDFSRRLRLSTYGVFSTQKSDLSTLNELYGQDLLGTPLESRTRNGEGDQNSHFYSYRLELMNIVEAGKRESLISLFASGSANTRGDNYLESIISTDSFTEGQRVDVDFGTSRIEGELKHRGVLGNVQFTAGLNSEQQIDTRDYLSSLLAESGSYVPDLSRNNDFEYRLTTHAAYVIGTTSFGAFSLQLGLRAENASTRFDLLTTSESFRNNYSTFFPSGFFLYKIADAQRIRLGYNKALNRPSTGQLNPFAGDEDRLNRFIGNPELGPEFQHNFELEYTFFGTGYTLILKPYYNVTVDKIDYFVFLQDGATVITRRNYDSFGTRGAEAALTLGPYAGFRYTFTANLRENLIDTGSLYGGRNEKASSWQIKNRLVYSGPGDLNLSANVTSLSDQLGAAGTFSGRTRINVTASKKFLDGKLTATARAVDVITGTGMSYFVNEAAYTQAGFVDFDSHRYEISLRYTIGSTPKTPMQPDLNIRDQGTGGFQ